MRCLIVLLCALCVHAGEVVLDLPNPLIPGAVMAGTLRVIDPPADVTAVDLPPVDGLEWRLSGRNGSNVAITNGVRSTVVSVGLELRGAARGTVTLPPVTVRMDDGSTLASAATTVRIDDGDARLTGDAFAEVAFDPAQIVPGQQTTLVYRLYLRRGEVSTLGIGPPEGSIAMGERAVATSQTVDAQGRPWTLTTISWPITCATPGTVTVGGQQEYQIVVGDGFFNQRAVRKQVAVPPASLIVSELPSAGRPADFSGLIGPLSASLALDRERVAASEGCLLSLTVSSRQTDLLKRPALAVAGVQLYPKDDRTDAGTRTFTWDVVPSAPGVITIPAVSLAYFDPGSLSYRTATTSSVTLTVIPGRNRDLGIVGQSTSAPTPATPAAPPALVLPQPLRGQVGPRPADWAPLAAGLGGMLVGGLLIGARALAGRRLGPHRGRALRSAGRDPAALDRALRALASASLTSEQQRAADDLRAALDRHRFGNEALPDVTPWLRQLEDVA